MGYCIAAGIFRSGKLLPSPSISRQTLDRHSSLSRFLSRPAWGVEHGKYQATAAEDATVNGTFVYTVDTE